MAEQSSADIEKIILDYAAKIGVQAKLDNLAKNQIEQIIASLESIEDEKLSLLVTASFAYRQAERLERGSRAAYHIAQAMKELHEKNYGRELARKTLGLAKWIYESIQNRRDINRPVNNFQEYLNLLLQRRS